MSCEHNARVLAMSREDKGGPVPGRSIVELPQATPTGAPRSMPMFLCPYCSDLSADGMAIVMTVWRQHQIAGATLDGGTRFYCTTYPHHLFELLDMGDPKRRFAKFLRCLNDEVDTEFADEREVLEDVSK